MILKVLIIIAVIGILAYVAILSPVTRKASVYLSKPFTKDTRKSFVLGLCLTLLVTGVYAFIMFNRTYPLTEGWYTVYAKYMLEGSQPYRDFELLFTPGYSYLIALIIRIFGFNLIVLRIFGAILFMSLAAILYLIFSRIFAPWISVVAATLAALYLQSEPAQVFYDYIRVYDFFNLLVCLFLIIGLKQQLNEREDTSQKVSFKTFRWTVFMGLSAGLAVQIRQNSGYLVLVYGVLILLFVLLLNREKKAKYLHIPVFLVSAILPFLISFIFLTANGMFDSYIRMTTSDAIASKGGLMAVLFAWIPRAFEQIVTEWKTVLVILILLASNILLFMKKKRNPISASSQNIWLVFYSLVSVGLILAMFWKQRISVFLKKNFTGLFTPYSLFAIGLIVFLFLGFYLLARNRRLKKEQRDFYLLVFAVSGLYIATAYGSATSGGMSEGQSAVIIALVIALLLYYSQHLFSKEMTALALSLAICFGMTAVATKYEVPYGWWGLTEPQIRTATETVAVPLMDGIFVSQEKKILMETVYNDIVENTDKDDSIFIFPHIPIFYAMTERYPDTFTLVQWFDVSSDKSIMADMETLSKNPPKVIVICDLPENAVEEHERLFRNGETAAQHMMMNELHRMTEALPYELLDTFDIGAEYYVSVYLLSDE